MSCPPPTRGAAGVCRGSASVSVAVPWRLPRRRQWRWPSSWSRCRSSGAVCRPAARGCPDRRLPGVHLVHLRALAALCTGSPRTTPIRRRSRRHRIWSESIRARGRWSQSNSWRHLRRRFAAAARCSPSPRRSVCCSRPGLCGSAAPTVSTPGCGASTPTRSPSGASRSCRAPGAVRMVPSRTPPAGCGSSTGTRWFGFLELRTGHGESNALAGAGRPGKQRRGGCRRPDAGGDGGRAENRCARRAPGPADRRPDCLLADVFRDHGADRGRARRRGLDQLARVRRRPGAHRSANTEGDHQAWSCSTACGGARRHRRGQRQRLVAVRRSRHRAAAGTTPPLVAADGGTAYVMVERHGIPEIHRLALDQRCRAGS